MKILNVREDDTQRLAKVKRLWRRHSDTLGFFPEGAFQEHSSKGWVLTAESKDGEFLGYLLYRCVSRGGPWPIAVIVHLCVTDGYRLNGVSRALVEHLFAQADKSFLRVEVKCRKDYTADKIWPKLGFTYVDEALGRSGLSVIKWQREFRQLPLLNLFQFQQTPKKFKAVLDANVLYRLQDTVPEASKHAQRRLAEEAKTLDEDWISDDVHFLITDETLNEIQRHADRTERERRRVFARKYERVKYDPEKEKELRERLIILFPGRERGSLSSDGIQLSQSIAAGANCFITQDRALLNRAKQVSSEFALSIFSPAEFTCRVDEVIRETQYRPASLAGSKRLSRSRIQSNEMASLHIDFLGASEKKGEFESRVRMFVAQRDTYNSEVWRDASGKQLALMVFEVIEDIEMLVHILRISNSTLAGTIARHILRHAVLASVKQNCISTRIIDGHFPSYLSDACEEFGFVKGKDGWIKLNPSFVGYSQDLLRSLESLRLKLTSSHPASELAERVIGNVTANGQASLADTERRLWPVKIIDAPLRNYIVPIRPSWAQHLFDADIADETLLGAREDLALRHENVYYRSTGFGGALLSPARILWYVTFQKGYAQCKQLRACSLLDEVVVGPAKHLFNRFKRLGIYEWRDILQTARNKPGEYIMALRFSNTEALSRPIDHKTLAQFLVRESGKKPVFRSPQTISARAFDRLYSFGHGLKEDI